MRSTTSFDLGDLVLVPFPFTDQTGTKRLPAVVVSSQKLHQQSVDLVIMAVTSQARPDSTLEVPVTRWQEAGLVKPSVVKPVFATIEERLILKTLGTLAEEDRNALRHSLAEIFDLDPPGK